MGNSRVYNLIEGSICYYISHIRMYTLYTHGSYMYYSLSSVNLRSAAFGTVELMLVPLCDCPCSVEEVYIATHCSVL